MENDINIEHFKEIAQTLGILVQSFIKNNKTLADLQFPFTETTSQKLYFWRIKTFIYTSFNFSSISKVSETTIILGPYRLPETDSDIPYVNSLIDDFISLSQHLTALLTHHSYQVIRSENLYLPNNHGKNNTQPYNASENIEEIYKLELLLFCHIKDNNRSATFKVIELFHHHFLKYLTIDQLKANFISLITLLTRVKLEQGNPVQTAFEKQDFYFRLASTITSPEQTVLYLKQAIDDFFNITLNHAKIEYTSTIQQIINCTENHLYSKVTLNAVAEYLDMNPKYLGRLFKQEMDCSFKEFLLNRRIHEAKRLLLFTDSPIGQISSDLAFASQSHFTDCFKKSTGFTPKKYRSSRIFYSF